MKAGEVKPYFDNLQADLASEADPQLRGWYETEISLSSEYQEAHTLQEKLQQFHGGLSLLLEQAGVAKEAAPEPEHETMETHESYADDEIDEDEYLTAEQRKQKSVLAWLEDITAEHGENLRQASAEPKRSKRERKQAIANARFARHFERFGPQNDHIVHDAEALGYVLDELLVSKPRVAELVTGSSVEYMHQHGLEFAGNHPAFAGIIRASLGERPSAAAFDSIFSAIYEKRNFVAKPIEAAQLHIYLAHALFETTDESNHAYYHKIVETAFLRNNIIPNKVPYASSVESVLALGHLKFVPIQVAADLQNARLAFGQACYAYLHLPSETHFGSYRQAVSKPIYEEILKRVAFPSIQAGRRVETNGDPEEDAFFANPQHYDTIEAFDLDNGARIDNSSEGKTIPTQWRDAYTSSELYRKRTQLLAPRALTHDMIRATLTNILGGDVSLPPTIDIPISPSLTVTFNILGDRENPGDFAVKFNHVISAVLDNYSASLESSRFRATPDRIMAVGIKQLLIEEGDFKFGSLVAVRPSVPEDIKEADPRFALINTLSSKAVSYADALKVQAELAAKKVYLREHRHNYLGRRPLKFRLPDDYRERGLSSFEVRQHPDRSHVLVTAHHTEGDVELLFDEDLVYAGRLADTNNGTALSFFIEDMVVSLITEWACRPVIETSEGIVRSDDTKSKVNLGFLRYLPQGQGFRERQRLRFRKEQNGGNLAVESLRRKPQDPTGLGRNSTYVRENYDPTKPPLEVYYDPRALR